MKFSSHWHVMLQSILSDTWHDFAAERASTIAHQSPAVSLTAFSQVLFENERVFMKDDDDYRY